MEKFTVHTGTAVPLRASNVDTDQIIPARYLKRITRHGYEDALFAAWRSDPDFILNDPARAGATVLVAGPDFGTGSSREHAVWALHEWGIRAVIAPSFGAIFQGNCVRNGIVPVVLDNPAVESLARQVESDPARNQVTVDLANLVVVAPDGNRHAFSVPDADREMLLEGLDSIAVTLKRDAEILAFRDSDRKRRPWIYLPTLQERL